MRSFFCWPRAPSTVCTCSLSGSGWPIHVQKMFLICLGFVLYLSPVSSHVNEAEQHCRRFMCQSTTATASCHAIVCECVFLPSTTSSSVSSSVSNGSQLEPNKYVTIYGTRHSMAE